MAVDARFELTEEGVVAVATTSFGRALVVATLSFFNDDNMRVGVLGHFFHDATGEAAVDSVGTLGAGSSLVTVDYGEVISVPSSVSTIIVDVFFGVETLGGDASVSAPGAIGGELTVVVGDVAGDIGS